MLPMQFPNCGKGNAVGATVCVKCGAKLVPASQGPRETRFSGLSGNEMYCAWMIGYNPGNLLVGNSVFSMGFLGGIGSGLRTFVGGEVKQYTDMIAEGRRLSLERFDRELEVTGGSGATGLTSELI